MYRFGATLRPIVDRLGSLSDSLMYSNPRDLGPWLGLACRALDGARSFSVWMRKQ